MCMGTNVEKLFHPTLSKPPATHSIPRESPETTSWPDTPEFLSLCLFANKLKKSHVDLDNTSIITSVVVAVLREK